MRTAANELFSYFIYDHLVIVQITKEIKQKNPRSTVKIAEFAV